MIRAAGPDELDDVVAFVAGQQEQLDRRITYVGTDRAGITADLDGLAPPWATTLRILRPDSGITGAVVCEWDEALGRAWVLGPWVAGDGSDWTTTAGALLDAALVQTPEPVTQYELSGEVANGRLAELARSRGWRASEVNHLLVADSAIVAAWTDAAPATAVPLRAAVPGDVDAVAALHDPEFPDSYTSAERMIDGQLDGSGVVLVAEDPAGAVVGFVAGTVNDDGEGFVDSVGVAASARRSRLGERLVVAAGRQLLDRSPLGRVALTVQDHRAPARALYQRLGFRTEGAFVAYRSWT